MSGSARSQEPSAGPAEWAGRIPPAGQRAREQAPLWFGLFGAPAAWGTHLGLSYLIVPHVCATGQTFWMHLITAVTAVIAALGVVTAWRVRRAAPRADTGPEVADRSGFLGLAGVVLSALFFLALLMGGLQPLLIDPCLST